MINVLKNKVAKMRAALDDGNDSYDFSDLSEEVFQYVLEGVLDLKNELEKVRRGTLFSQFSQEEITAVEQKDSEISHYMHILWYDDNSYYMHLDFLVEDFERDMENGWTNCKTVEEYEEALIYNHCKGILDVLDEVLKYVEKNYLEK